AGCVTPSRSAACEKDFRSTTSQNACNCRVSITAAYSSKSPHRPYPTPVPGTGPGSVPGTGPGSVPGTGPGRCQAPSRLRNDSSTALAVGTALRHHRCAGGMPWMRSVHAQRFDGASAASAQDPAGGMPAVSRRAGASGLAQLEAVAERIRDVGALDAGDRLVRRHVDPPATEQAHEGCEVIDHEARMR